MSTAFSRPSVVRILSLCTLASALLGTMLFLRPPEHAFAATATFTESNQTTLYTHTQLVNKGVSDFTDAEMGVWQNGTTYNFLGSDAANANHTTIVSGSLDDPAQTVSYPHLAINNIPANTYNYISGGPVYKDSTTGDLITFVHLERWVNSCCYTPFWASLGLAISKDNGATWTWCGEIIQHNDPFSSSLQNSEEISSGGFVIINGYFYVYFTDYDTSHTGGIAVARALVSNVVNAAINDQVTSWSKYYQGAWNEPGLGGRFTNVLGRPYEGEVNISYNSYLNQYILAINYGTTDGHYYISLRSSDNPLDFSASSDNEIAYRASGYSQYPTFVGLGSDPQWNSGQTFYVYYITWGSDGIWNTGTTLSRSTITATLGAATGPAVGNSSFETPSVGPVESYSSYQYTPAGATWSFSGQSGIAANGSGFTNNNPNAPDGVQVAFLQNVNSTVSQSINNFIENTSYSFTFAAAERGNTGQGGQSIQVYLDGVSLGQYTPASTSYADITTTSITPGAGSHTLQFVGLASCDCTALIDNVRINQGTIGASYQASTGFTSLQGQNQWLYQYSTNGELSFQNLSWDSTDSAWVDPQGYTDYCDIWQNAQHPNASTCDSTRVWIAPTAGIVSLNANGPVTVNTGSSCGGNTSGVNIRILKNGSQIWPSSGWQNIPNGGSYTFPGNISTTVAVGDHIQFVDAHAGSVNYCDRTTWDQTVSYTAQASYQASTGFSSVQGQNQWLYQYSTNGEQSFQNLSWDNTDSAWVDPQGYTDYCDIWQNAQHPNASTCDSSRVWVAPTAGTVSLNANGPVTVVTGSNCGGNTSGVNIRILKNGSQIWPSSGWQNIPNGGSYTFPSGVSTSVAVGDHIQFVDAHAGSVNYCDKTTWDQVVSYT